MFSQSYNITRDNWDVPKYIAESRINRIVIRREKISFKRQGNFSVALLSYLWMCDMCFPI